MEHVLYYFIPLDILGIKKNYYMVGTNGIIYRKSDGHRYKFDVNNAGYLRMHFLLEGGGKKRFFIHRVISMAFNPNDDCDNLQVNHKDGNKTNNRLSNLEWVTASENQLHSFRTGLAVKKYHGKPETVPRGSEAQNALVDETAIHRICTLICEGKHNAEIKRELKLSLDPTQYNSLLHHIRKRNSWHHITKLYSY